MLMLTRKKNESFVIDFGGETVRISVARIGFGTETEKRDVQLGIDAPREYKVWRTEIYDTMQENRRAAFHSPSPEYFKM